MRIMQSLNYIQVLNGQRAQMQIGQKPAQLPSQQHQGASSSSNGSNSQASSSEKTISGTGTHFSLPQNSQNRVGRWTNQELASLKLAMSIFGDQSWKKIQQFLIQREKDSKKSKSILKKEKLNSSQFTYRSIKAIQSKIYGIKPELEKENELIKTFRCQKNKEAKVPLTVTQNPERESSAQPLQQIGRQVEPQTKSKEELEIKTNDIISQKVLIPVIQPKPQFKVSMNQQPIKVTN